MKKFAIFSALLLQLSALNAACPGHTLFDSILKANVDKEGFVDYDSIRIGKGGDLYEYLSFLETADLKDCTESDRLAFWINAYNANAIKLILARPQLKMISEDFKIFGEKFKVARIDVTLNEIEHRIIRSSAKKGGPIPGISINELDPRIHFALVTGAIDSPKLLNKAYTGNALNGFLESNAIAFANNPKYVSIQDGKLVVSNLVRWYAEDFDKVGGVPSYLMSLSDPALRPDANEVDEKLKTDYPANTSFKYDWTLNSIKNKPQTPAESKPPK